MSEAPAKTPVITPSRLGRYLEKKLSDDRHLRFVGVQGELSNVKLQANGNAYFSIKDREAVLNCVGFAERSAGFPPLENGAEVIAFGEVKIYAKASSTYQLIVSRIELAGVGALHARYEELKRRLDRDGMFADARKKRLPRFPFHVALVGSPSGDGTRDFITQARSRAPHVGMRLFPTPVNGVAAVPEIVRAINAADASGADLIVVVRGGGSYEDLFGFSDERVIRAIAACATPTIAAIGHERDQPLIELAADARASTPSTVAQTALPRRDDLLREVGKAADDARRAFALRLERSRTEVDRIERRSPLADPNRLLHVRRQTVDGIRLAVATAFERRVDRGRRLLAPIDRRLTVLSPTARLERRRGRVAQLANTIDRVRASVNARHAPLEAIERRLAAAAARVAERKQAVLTAWDVRLKVNANNPDVLLQKGYAIVKAGDRVVRGPDDAPPGTRLEVEFARGTLRARVERDGVDGGEQITLF